METANSPKMQSEMAHKVTIYDFPRCLLQSIQDKPEWQLVNVTNKPLENQYYEIQYNGKKVLQLYKMHGFEFGSSAFYGSMRKSVINLLRTVISVEIDSFRDKVSENVIYPNDYTENV